MESTIWKILENPTSFVVFAGIKFANFVDENTSFTSIFEVINMIKSRVSVFFIYLYPYLRACQWTVDTWITFDRRNWQDTSFVSNFGLACIWNFVAMFHIFTLLHYLYMYVSYILNYTNMYWFDFMYILFMIDLYPYFYRQHKHRRAHTHYGSQSYCTYSVLQGRFRSHISEGSCRHGKNGRQRELVSPTLGSYRKKPRELARWVVGQSFNHSITGPKEFLA